MKEAEITLSHVRKSLGMSGVDSRSRMDPRTLSRLEADRIRARAEFVASEKRMQELNQLDERTFMHAAPSVIEEEEFIDVKRELLKTELALNEMLQYETEDEPEVIEMIDVRDGLRLSLAEIMDGIKAGAAINYKVQGGASKGRGIGRRNRSRFGPASEQ